MTQIDKTKPVLVTGATGYVAGWLVKKLLEDGITVHAAVRNPDKKEKIAHLEEIAAKSPGSIKYFKSDLLEEGSYAEAMEGCELVFHTASPFVLDVKDAQKDLIDPAVKGTQNVLNQANKTSSVMRVVLTSSCAAMYTDAVDTENEPGGKITEDTWNHTASLNYQPYSYSKTLAEKEAWSIAKEQNRWDMVVINPSFVMGPSLNPKMATSESIRVLKQMGSGAMKMGVPKIGFGVIDVRDLATAHFNAGFVADAHGRNIISAHNTDMLEMVKPIQAKYGKKYPIKAKALPKWIVWTFGPMLDKALDRKYISKNVNHKFTADNSKAVKELGLNYRPLNETMVESFDALVENGVI
ncbi:NAD-dependent epimerase/dehydratase family protein [Paracrocinitomix mangrovi]|uniref:NAD-dependent epimerase/dehydratase family protein n=1 Tax=Paracrocinitomix mangrovi TaxID=2862509 RepID=UPI001C8E9AD4|nr:NAD-dependent epimerase/dehydratase family protein [Paracrocinitomix mangrovi]UKN00439.1 NAD-dependent epimerase/dehydratase family protein [Paracrocinitomix mangrovi]